MASLPHQITFDCADAYTLAQFWSQVFERPLHDDDNPGDPMALIEFEAGPGVLFIGVPEGKSVKNRLHLDVMPTDRTRDEEVERLLAAGATDLRGSPPRRRHGLGDDARPRGQRVLRRALAGRASRLRSPRVTVACRAGPGDSVARVRPCQYDGWEGSIWLTQADTPPPTCTELA